jgi:hypothetical protein
VSQSDGDSLAADSAGYLLIFSGAIYIRAGVGNLVYRVVDGLLPLNSITGQLAYLHLGSIWQPAAGSW